MKTLITLLAFALATSLQLRAASPPVGGTVVAVPHPGSAEQLPRGTPGSPAGSVEVGTQNSLAQNQNNQNLNPPSSQTTTTVGNNGMTATTGTTTVGNNGTTATTANGAPGTPVNTPLGFVGTTNGVNNNGLNNSFNSTNGFSTVNGSTSLTAVAGMLGSLQANIEQTLSALASLNAQVGNGANANANANSSANGNSLGFSGQVQGTTPTTANQRAMTASGNTSGVIPPASASASTGRSLRPTGNTVTTSTPTGVAANEVVTTDARTLEMIRRLQEHLRLSDELLQSLTGSANVNGNVNGTANGSVNGNGGFLDRFSVSPNTGASGQVR